MQMQHLLYRAEMPRISSSVELDIPGNSMADMVSVPTMVKYPH